MAMQLSRDFSVLYLSAGYPQGVAHFASFEECENYCRALWGEGWRDFAMITPEGADNLDASGSGAAKVPVISDGTSWLVG